MCRQVIDLLLLIGGIEPNPGPPSREVDSNNFPPPPTNEQIFLKLAHEHGEVSLSHTSYRGFSSSAHSRARIAFGKLIERWEATGVPPRIRDAVLEQDPELTLCGQLNIKKLFSPPSDEDESDLQGCHSFAVPESVQMDFLCPNDEDLDLEQ
jgi:hypothetical protein